MHVLTTQDARRDQDHRSDGAQESAQLGGAAAPPHRPDEPRCRDLRGAEHAAGWHSLMAHSMDQHGRDRQRL